MILVGTDITSRRFCNYEKNGQITIIEQLIIEHLDAIKFYGGTRKFINTVNIKR